MLNSIYFHLKSQNIEIIKNCLLSLIEISRHYYDYIGENMEEFVNISNLFVKKQNSFINIFDLIFLFIFLTKIIKCSKINSQKNLKLNLFFPILVLSRRRKHWNSHIRIMVFYS